MIALPASPQALAKATWDDVRAVYDALAAVPLSDQASIESWLADWSAFESMLGEAGSRAMIRYTVNTRDAEAEADAIPEAGQSLPCAVLARSCI